ncbi:MAG TPA: hypothetical protein VMI56_24245 [Reyranella sp.]|nr:hypothetical protein [Reyranella sp.]
MTLALRSADYAEMAVDLALSLREWHDEPIGIAVDATIEGYIARHYPEVFDFVVRLPETAPIGWACKFAIAEVTPFARTVFLDADNIACASLHSLLADAERVDLAMLGEHLPSSAFREPGGSPVLHNGWPLESAREFGLDRYFKNHSGAFVFERNVGRRFFSDCMALWLSSLAQTSPKPFTGPGDEIVLGVLGARLGMTRVREPYPIYWIGELKDVRSDNRRKPLVHFNTRPTFDMMKWLIVEVAARRRRNGLSGWSVGHWLKKSNLRIGRKRKWINSILNLELLRHMAWRTYVLDRQVGLPAPRAGASSEASLETANIVEYLHPTLKTPGSRIDGSDLIWAMGDGSFGRHWNASNLLLHATSRRQLISTPHHDLILRERWHRDFQVPVALEIHLWPGPPQDLAVLAQWRQRDHRPVLEIELRGPLPLDPSAVLCVRFRGQQARKLDPSLQLVGNLRSVLVSDGTLLNSVTAFGVGNKYIVGITVSEECQAADHALSVPAQAWPYGFDELFLEFRLFLSGIASADEVVRLEFSCFYLGQEVRHSLASGVNGTAISPSQEKD